MVVLVLVAIGLAFLNGPFAGGDCCPIHPKDNPSIGHVNTPHEDFGQIVNKSSGPTWNPHLHHANRPWPMAA